MSALACSKQCRLPQPAAHMFYMPPPASSSVLPVHAAVVVSTFQDLHISVHAGSNNSSSTALHEQVDHGRPALAASGGASVMSLTSYSSHRVAVEKKKLAIILVGLPGRGKTFLCNKLRCYLNW